MWLPMGTVHHEQNMAPSTVCPISNSAEDSWHHSLIECNMARCVWALGDEETLDHMIPNQAEDARLWLFLLFDSMQQEELARVLVTLWAICWARWRAIHGREFHSPLSTMGFIKRYLADLEIAAVRQRKSNHSTSGSWPAANKWIPP